MEGRVTVEQLRAEAGTEAEPGRGSITAAVVVLREPGDGDPPSFRLYVRCSWRPDEGFLGVHVLWAKGLRVHRTFEPWLSLLKEHRYRGVVPVYREDDPALADLGLPGRTAP